MPPYAPPPPPAPAELPEIAGRIASIGMAEIEEAVERLVAALAHRGRPTTAHVLDGLLWNAGQAPEIKASPRHRARCSFY